MLGNQAFFKLYQSILISATEENNKSAYNPTVTWTWVAGFCSQSGVLALIRALSKTWGSQINLLPNDGKISKNIGFRHLPCMLQVSMFSLGMGRCC